ncbi:C-type lectin domain family 12 member B-like [Anabas testudineus]|uniref:C-type lectin domain-containing protein n=1 Tax=Anabas testudineus TaxID=64144 RepID=A0A3Q1K968_ANATE|nr:C-type lectin domain family 12 member B-like [Anabas testudineus]
MTKRKTKGPTVMIRNPNVSVSTEKIEEDVDYCNVAERTVHKMETTSDVKDQTSPSVIHSVRSLSWLMLLWIPLLLILSLHIYFTAVISENYTKLTIENQELETQNQELETQNQELRTQRNNLTQQIQNMETKCNEQNISRAQWTIDTYCPKVNNERQCKACPKGWENVQTSCFAIHNARPDQQRTWEGAREDCRGRSSDLAVIDNEAQKTFITGKSWTESGINGYWIGLRGENGRWKWINGSFLTESSWVQQPPTNNNSCAASLQNLNPWKSMDCDVKNAWICGQQALIV